MRREEAAVKPPGFEALGAAGIGSSLPDDSRERFKVSRDAFEGRQLTVEMPGVDRGHG